MYATNSSSWNPRTGNRRKPNYVGYYMVAALVLAAASVLLFSHMALLAFAAVVLIVLLAEGFYRMARSLK